MESPKYKVEMIQQAIRQLMEEDKQNYEPSSSDESPFIAVDNIDDNGQSQDDRLLRKILSQLETLKGDAKIQQSEQSTDAEIPNIPAVGKTKSGSETASEVDGTDEIIKELRNVKRQNFITHCLVSVMIILTVAWQLSEVSLILKVKEGLSNPLKSLGSMITGMIKRPKINGQGGAKQSKNEEHHDASLVHSIRISELPHVQLPGLDLGDDQE